MWYYQIPLYFANDSHSVTDLSKNHNLADLQWWVKSGSATVLLYCRDRLELYLIMIRKEKAMRSLPPYVRKYLTRSLRAKSHLIKTGLDLFCVLGQILPYWFIYWFLFGGWAWIIWENVLLSCYVGLKGTKNTGMCMVYPWTVSLFPWFSAHSVN